MRFLHADLHIDSALSTELHQLEADQSGTLQPRIPAAMGGAL